MTVTRVLIAHNVYRISGGEERHVALLDEALRASGVTVSRLSRRSDELAGSFAARVRLAAGLVYRPSGGRAIERAVHEEKPDLVHFHNIWPLLTPAALHAAKRAGTKVVFTAHNHRLFCPTGTLSRNGEPHVDCIHGSSLMCGLRGGRDSRLESAVYGAAVEVQRRLRLVDRWVDAYIAPSAYLARVLTEAGVVEPPGDRLTVIPYGVPVDVYAPRERRFMLFAGRLSVEKGIETLLAAAKRTPDVPLVIAGDGPAKRQVELAQSANVTYVGQVAATALDTLRREAAATLVPSVCADVQPYSALESLAAGVPIVASNLGGLPELAQDGDSLLVPPGDAGALADAIRSAWHSSQAEPRWGERSHGVAARRFGIEAHARDIIALYERLLRDEI